MRRSTTRRRRWGIGVLLAATVAVASSAAASGGAQVRVTHPRDVAGRSPYVGRHCNIPTPGWVAKGGVEAEPTVAVDPRDSGHQVAAWMDTTRSSIDTAFSRDAGRTWSQSVPHGVDACGGNHKQQWEASGDVWLSFDGDGTVYLSTLAWAHFVTEPTSRYVSVVYVLRSQDGGRTWSRPTLASTANGTSDKDMIVADRRHPGTVYVAYDNSGFGLVTPPRGGNRLIVSKSTDYGRSWHRTVIARFPQDRAFFNSQLTILKHNTLVLTATGPDRSGEDAILAWRSADGGSSWSGPIEVAKLTDGQWPTFCGISARGTEGSATARIGPRSLALVINDAAAAEHGRGKLILVRSSDAGRTWHSSTAVRSTRTLLLASVAGHLDGSVGLVYDAVDTSAVRCGASPTVPTRTLVRTSTDRGDTWSDSAVVGARWFNQSDALVGSQYFLGDYQNIIPSWNGFTTVTVQGRSLTGHDVRGLTGKTGVVVARAPLP
jgi:hypothetical protein